MNKEVENEKEFIDRDEEAVSNLVGGLKHVEAPDNFERRVMSLIAGGEPKTRSFFFFSGFDVSRRSSDRTADWLDRFLQHASACCPGE